jgi:hypothetical protein
MIQDIKFQGLSNSPSDNSVQDGELGSCLNLIPEDGELKPIQQPVMVDGGDFLSEDVTIEYLHKVSYDDKIISHYICYDSLNDIWFWHILGEPTEDVYQIQLPTADKFHVNSVKSIGNILCFVGDDDIWYAFWDSNTKDYKIFNLSQFKLSIEIERNATTDEVIQKQIKLESEEFWNLFEKHYWDDDKTESLTYPIRTKANKTIEIFNQCDALVNKRMEELGDEYFKYSTLLVAAVRLYDGTYINFSPLAILDATQVGSGNSDSGYSRVTPSFAYWINYDDSQYIPVPKKSQGIEFSTGFAKFWITASCDIKGYETLIDGVDVFITTCESFLDIKNSVYIGTPQINHETWRRSEIPIPYLQGNDFHNQFDGLQFYKTLHIANQQLGQKFPIKRVLGTEVSISLANPYVKHIGGIVANNYNNRLHIGNIVESIKSTDYDIPFYNIVEQSDENSACDLVFEFTDDNKEKLFFSVENKKISTHNPIVSIPINGYSDLVVYSRCKNYDGEYVYTKTPFKLYSSSNTGYSYYVKCDSKNGLQEFIIDTGASNAEEFEKALNSVSTSKNIISRSPSLIKVSEAENPLVFPASNSVQVGSSVIKAMAANTRPITEGQFGDAPLYVFTDEGTWMLMLSTDGVYQARQPVNRDVCSNPDGILQIDDAVLFPTERGIMMQTGSTAKLITDALDGAVFDYMQLYKESYSKKILAVGSIPEAGIKYIPFRQFMKGADMVYDYYDARIIVFNPDCAYAYVYSLKSGLWGAMESNIKKRVNIYPESYAINGDRKIVDFYQSQPVGPTRYFLCTRPMAIGSAEAYKTMFSCIARGYFRNEVGKCGMALYASNDLFKWFPVSTSVNKFLRGMCGSPYKYFRLALIGSLLPEESLGGLSADYQERWQNKLR